MSVDADIDAVLPGGVQDSDTEFHGDDGDLCSRCGATIGEDDQILLLWQLVGKLFYQYCENCFEADDSDPAPEIGR